MYYAKQIDESGETVALHTMSLPFEESGIFLPISEEEYAGWVALADGLSPAGKPSMAQDGDAKRKSEVELFAGTMVRLARKHGTDVPINRWLYDRVRQMEAKYE